MKKRGFLYHFARNPKGMVGLILLAAIVLAVVLIPLFMDLDPEKVYFVKDKAPSADHIMGLDTSFQDCFSKLVIGGRVSLLIGGGTSLITLIIGVPLGLIAGFYRKRVGAAINRTAEIFLSFPVMVLLLLMVAVFSHVTPLIIIVVMGCVSWPGTAKMLYSMAISVMNNEYILAVRAMGKSNARIMFTDVLPNSITPVLVSLPFRVSISIMLETTLAFLGLGVATSWGRQIYLATTMNVMVNQMWMWLPPTICLVAVIVSVNMLGEGIRDSYDPKSARESQK
ncbi:MAG: ABC transporter permease [Clostridiales Family XIII bacterium]|jgi:peptide/nickel transport system permease protein|nr:ABC transporter permease [Clostridiales Family XIII bacterium]